MAPCVCGPYGTCPADCPNRQPATSGVVLSLDPGKTTGWALYSPSLGIARCGELDLRHAGDMPSLPRDVEMVAYRTAQEALTNISRHSSAKRVTVELKTANDRLSLRVLDDGEGMPVPPAPPSGSLGLIGMAERANALNGVISIRNAPPAGVEILVDVPLQGAHP